MKKKVFKRAISILLVLSMVLSSFADVKAKSSNKYVGEGFEVEFKVASQWKGTFNGSITITNTSDTVIENWALRFKTPNEISNIWNATIQNADNGTYVISNVSWNQDIPIGGSINFGFTAKGDEVYYPTNYKIPILQQEVDSKNYSVEFNLKNSWGKGFLAEINIKNLTDKEIEDWVLEFDFDKTITEIWNGEIAEQIGNHYKIKGASYKQNIGPKETISIGLNGKDGATVKEPINYIFRELIVENEKYIQLADGEIERDYLYDIIYPNLLLGDLSIDDIKLSDDYDGDGLTLIEEYEYDTNPFLADTDEDGLSDYDEIYIYFTDPNKFDTDEDGLSDGTEVECGLNPLVKDTDGNGIIDGEEILNQKVRLNFQKDYELDEVGTLPSVAIKGKGDFSQKMYATEVEHDEAVLDIDCLVGTPFDFIHDEELDFESSNLSFKISEELLKKHKIEDLAIAYYDENINLLNILNTNYDTENKEITAEVNHYSKYMVIDLPEYYTNADWKNEESAIKSGKADVVFVVDTTGSMGGAIRNVRNNISQFVNDLEENDVDIRLGLVEFRDIYEDGENSTKSYDWYTNVSSFREKLASLGIDGGGDTPESAVDALHVAQNMKFRVGVNKYIILITDANYKDGIAGNPSVTMQDEIDKLVKSDINTSVVTDPWYSTVYDNLVKKTDGIIANINDNFAVALEPLIDKMKNANEGFWIRLSNGSIVRLDADPKLGDDSVDTDNDGIPDVIELKEMIEVESYNPYTNKFEAMEMWTFYSNPVKEDTDGDGLMDADDLRPSMYDTVIVEESDEIIRFNSGKVWSKISCSAFDFVDNAMRVVDNHVDNPIPLEEFGAILRNDLKNSEQEFNIDELTVIGLFNTEGSKLYMNGKSSYIREAVFQKLAGRESDDYKRTGILGWQEWKKVDKGTQGGFFKGTVLSEADINFSLEMDMSYDIYTTLDGLVKTGAVVIAVILVTEATPVVLANIQGLIYYIKIFGVAEGLKMYQYLGVDNLPNSIITWVQWDVQDGDSSLDDLIGANIPIHQRGITGEKALQEALPNGTPQVYFPIQDETLRGGRYVDVLDGSIAHEAKVGYTCLSSRIKIQILKDSYLLNTKDVSRVIWHFYVSDTTGKGGASKPLIEFLEQHGIEVIFH